MNFNCLQPRLRSLTRWRGTALLDCECAGKPELRARLDELPAAHFRLHPELDQPAVTRANGVFQGSCPQILE
jgi:hypothetical protein